MARASPKRLRRLLVAMLIGIASTAAAAEIGLRIAFAELGEPPVEASLATSVAVLDREDRLLRAFTTADGRWRLPVEVDDVDARYIAMLIAFEDRRFWWHPGVDPIAMVRAAGQLVRHRRIVSGGSTITMQVARLLDGPRSRSASTKFWQMVRALQLERRYSKAEILRLYLRLAPFGGNIEGARAATLAYYGKEPRRLSIAEAALLVALPQSPRLRRPDRRPDLARKARERVLDRALLAGLVSADERVRAGAETMPDLRLEFPRLAAHLAEAVRLEAPATSVHRLTIDARIQRDLERLAREHTRPLGPRLSAAVLVIDHMTGEVLAHVGSAGYLDDERFGAIDMTRVVRSPGSTLKPLIYGLAFELGILHPETLIEDLPARFGNYNPKNFDEEFHGTVTIREALTASLNIPAVKVIERIGPQRVTAALRRAGLVPSLPGTGEPSLAIALGGIGLRLQDLGQLFAAIARGGESVALRHRREEPGQQRPDPPRRRVLGAVAAWYLADILKDAPAPTSARSGVLAYKTGTSYGYRDAWAVGFDGRVTIAVWVGRPDATSTAGLTGRTAAAPLLFDAFTAVSERRAPLTPSPTGAITSAGSALPPPLRRFKEVTGEPRAGAYLDPGVQIAFPPDRSVIEIDPGDELRLALKAEGGALPLTWLIDGEPIAEPSAAREIDWLAGGRGFARITVIDALGRTDRVTVRIK